MKAISQTFKALLITSFWIVLVRILEVISKQDNYVLFFIGFVIIQLYCVFDQPEKDKDN